MGNFQNLVEGLDCRNFLHQDPRVWALNVNHLQDINIKVITDLYRQNIQKD